MKTFALLLCLAQVGLIIMSDKPDKARALEKRARTVQKSIAQRLARGPVGDSGKQKMLALAADLTARADELAREVPGDVPLSLNEKDEVDRGVKLARQVAAWLERRAKGAAPAKAR